VHRVDAAGGAVVPPLAQLRLERTRPGAAGKAPQAFQLRREQRVAGHLAGPPQLRRGAVGEHLEAALLRLHQVPPVLPAGRVDGAGRERARAEGALLPGELPALHEIEQGDQGPGDRRIGGAVGRLEHHRQQVGNQPGECRGGFRDRKGLLRHARAQRRQRLQPLQRDGHPAEQAGAVAGRCLRSVEPLEFGARPLLGRVAFLHLPQALRREAGAW